MNKVYKTIWSKVKNMYVTVCEFAKSYAKFSGKFLGRITIIGVFALILSFGMNRPIYAYTIFECGPGANDDYSNWLNQLDIDSTYFQLTTENEEKLDSFLKANFSDSFSGVDNFGYNLNYFTLNNYAFLVDKNNNFYYLFQLYANGKYSNFSKYI